MEFLQTLLDLILRSMLALGMSISLLIGGLFVPPPTPTAYEPTLSETTLPTEEEVVAPAAATTTPSPVVVEPERTPTPIPAAPAVSTPTPIPTTPATTKTADQVNQDTRKALVNILCTTQAGENLKPISGSGLLIDSRGVVLTNAHIGQFFLLRDYGFKDNVDCTIRVGSPAQPRYRAKLVYLPAQWINDNASQLVAAQAIGTGENDFAFLLITSTTDPNGTLPSSFPAIETKTTQPDVGEQMLLAAYPAGFLSGELITTSLYQSSALAYVTKLYSFDNSPNVELFSIGGTVVSQSGSSGGAAVRNDGTLAGIIATATVAESTGQRDLRAVTVFHIDRALAQQGEAGINGLLSANLLAKATLFNTTVAPALTKKLTDVLNGQ